MLVRETELMHYGVKGMKWELGVIKIKMVV